MIDCLATASGSFPTFGNWLKNLAQYFKPITVRMYFALLYDWFISLPSFVMIDHWNYFSVKTEGSGSGLGSDGVGCVWFFCTLPLVRYVIKGLDLTD